MLPLNGDVLCRSVWVECKERAAKGEGCCPFLQLHWELRGCKRTWKFFDAK